jgi:hypothetical protein
MGHRTAFYMCDDTRSRRLWIMISELRWRYILQFRRTFAWKNHAYTHIANPDHFGLLNVRHVSRPFTRRTNRRMNPITVFSLKTTLGI